MIKVTLEGPKAEVARVANKLKTYMANAKIEYIVHEKFDAEKDPNQAELAV